MNNTTFKPGDRIRCPQLPDWWHGVHGLLILSLCDGVATLQFCQKHYDIDTLAHWNNQNEETQKSTIAPNGSLQTASSTQTKRQLSTDD